MLKSTNVWPNNQWIPFLTFNFVWKQVKYFKDDIIKLIYSYN